MGKTTETVSHTGVKRDITGRFTRIGRFQVYLFAETIDYHVAARFGRPPEKFQSLYLFVSMPAFRIVVIMYDARRIKVFVYIVFAVRIEVLRILRARDGLTFHARVVSYPVDIPMGIR